MRTLALLNWGIKDRHDLNHVRLVRQLNGLNLFYTAVAMSVGVLSVTVLGNTSGGKVLGLIQVFATFFYAGNLVLARLGYVRLVRHLTIHGFEWHLFACSIVTGLWYSPVMLVIVLFPLLAALVEVSIAFHLGIGIFQFSIFLVIHFFFGDAESSIVSYMGLSEGTSVFLRVMGLFYFPFMAAGIIRIIFSENLRQRKRLKDMFGELESAHDQLRDYAARLKDESVKLRAELNVAKEIQKMVLPHEHELAVSSDLDISCLMQAADEVGGDYYDVLQASDGNPLIAIGDVTGHGLASGLIMLMAQTTIKTLSENGYASPELYFNRVNSVLHSNIQRLQEDRNMTLALLQYRQNGQFRISGQHESVIIIRSDGNHEIFDTMELGFFVGMMPDIEPYCKSMDLSLDDGDLMLLYSDGVTEAENETGEQFGQERMVAILKRYRAEESVVIRRHLMRKLYNFIGNTEIFDDITVMVIKMRGE